ncbi:MAG: pentapeptide repeat-containing protein [Thermodesulfobacteriota bacterium]
MTRIRKYFPLIIFIIPVTAILLILGPTRFNKPVKGSSDSLSVRTENDFVTDPGLVALPGEDIVAVLLESQDCSVLEKDTGGKGYDIIPYRYTAPMEQTFCWDDRNKGAGHYMVLVDDEGVEVLQVNANGECATGTVEAGDYEMRVFHDEETEKNVAVFIVPENNKSTLSTASDETLENISTFLDTDRCVGCDLSGANLYNADLSGVDLEGAKLNDAILANANLSGANLKGAELRNADLTGAKLKGATLAGADLTNAVLINSDLSDADLTAANMEGADVTGANFGNANLTGVLQTKSADTGADAGEDIVSLSEELEAAPTDTCSEGKLAPGDGTKDLLISAKCDVSAGVYLYQNVNVIQNGVLNFVDGGGETHFWAKSILVENNGTISAGTTQAPFGKNKSVLTIHLYGGDSDKTGIECRTPKQNTNDPPCGIDKNVWTSNGGSKVTLPPGNISDYFYQYTQHDNTQGETGFFGRKVLAVSYGGTLKLYGKKGAKYGDNIPNYDSGTSWVRLKNDKDASKTLIFLDRDVDWEVGDRIVVTTTDYLPGHSEELQIVKKEGPRKLRITIVDPATNMPPAGCVTDNPNVDKCGLRWVHNGDTYPDTDFNFQSDDLKRLSLNIKLANGGVDNGKALAETRAAVALLSRSIRIVSAGDSIPAESGRKCKFDCFPTGFYGGHTMLRQGIKLVQIQGVEFYQLGQGGRKGRYPVHLHLLRKAPPTTFVKDSSINESMTRWITFHGTQNVTAARNVGWKSIGHGYYLEDGTETDNKLYSNIGIFARAALNNVQNPRQVPGILAYAVADVPFGKQDTVAVPYHSDYAQPAVFWIMNGWNDFEYNMAAGANACGICYWWLPGAISGMSQDQKWESYASQQSNLGRAGLTPLKNFKGNYCSSAMNAFNSIQDISPCLGVGGIGGTFPTLEPVTVGNISPAPKPGEGERYYPKVNGSHNPTKCDQTDCSNAPVCTSGDRKNCVVAVIDRLTTAFHWAETNFSAIWLRPRWYLVINSVISDVQSAGLTFVTGGDYTESNFFPGQWQLARQNVFIGQTQPNNPLASAAGPVNKGTNLKCADQTNGVVVNSYCLLKDEGISFPLANFANNQRLFNIYDGPSFEDSNAFFDIKKTFIDDCTVGQGSCSASKSMYGRVPLMPYDKKKNQCYLPNAAIAWKQPNGFYYPPAFHSANLYFRNNVDIRHFVIEPLFQPGKFAFQSDDERTKQNYCTFTLNNSEGFGGSFGNFSAIDRQTILNDDDGSLTGLKNTISVNEDPFFNAPTETLECQSEETAKTSPYDYVTTVIYPDCVAKKNCGGVCKVDKKPCADTSNCADIPNNTCDDSNAFWNSDCGSSFCYGVPLYRQLLTKDEASNTKGAEIRMMGMNFFQRSNLTANHGVYYIDTTVSDANQRAGLNLAPLQKPSVNVFKGGETYYVLFIFAKANTKQTYQIYVGNGFDPEKDVSGIQSPLKKSRPLDVNSISWPAKWTRKWYKDDPSTGILEVTVDFSDFKTQFDNARKDRCQPETFCTWTGSAATGSCGCSDKLKTSNPELYAECTKSLGDNKNNICSWAVRAVDCPEGGCYGFAVNLKNDPPAEPIAPPAPCCFPDNPDWNVNFSPVGQNVAGSCQDSNPPKPEFCTSPVCPTTQL